MTARQSHRPQPPRSLARKLVDGAVGTVAGAVGVVAILGMATALALPRISVAPALR